jgi:hypothetical protein
MTKSLFSLVFEKDSCLWQIGQRAFSESGLANLILPSSVKVIEVAAFRHCHSLKLLKFESGTRLRTIESFLFSGTALTNLSLPNSGHSINGSAFVNCHVTCISFFPSPTAFELRADVLEDISGRELIRYFGNSQLIEISSSVQMIRSHCFAYYQRLERLTFQVNSRLEVIEDSTQCQNTGYVGCVNHLFQ